MPGMHTARLEHSFFDSSLRRMPALATICPKQALWRFQPANTALNRNNCWLMHRFKAQAELHLMTRKRMQVHDLIE